MLNYNKHKNILLKILKDIYTNTAVGPFVGFKGGTAAYFFHNLDRFSVDLDFDLLNDDEADVVLEKLEEIAKKYGKVKDCRKKRYSLFLLLSYQEEAPNIKIEINRRSFNSSYEILHYLGIPMKVMVKEDMFAHKIVAMHERMGNANRDIFDVWFFLSQGWGINREIVEKRTEMLFVDFLEKCINGLDKVSDKGILAGMGDLLSNKQKDWVVQDLRKDTIFSLKMLIEEEKGR